jgi:predicted nucleotidyltransferase
MGTIKNTISLKKSDNCLNYRSNSLLNSGYKIYAKTINKRFKTISEAIILEEQNRFRIGRSCINNVLIIKQVIEKRRECNLENHMVFLDLKKAFGRVNRNLLLQILNRRGIPYHIIEVIKSLYRNNNVQIDTGKNI